MKNNETTCKKNIDTNGTNSYNKAIRKKDKET